MSQESCTCESCARACEYKPGWFSFGQIEKTAQYLNLSVKEFFDKYIMVDVFYAGGQGQQPEDVFVLSPKVVGLEGNEAGFRQIGRCVFLKEGLCTIHEVKPWECKKYHCDIRGTDAVWDIHVECMNSWNTPEAQQQIKDLLGKELVSSQATFADLIKLMNEKSGS